MDDRTFESQHTLWLISFSLASWLFFSIAFMNQKIFDFLYKIQSNEKKISSLLGKREIAMIVENSDAPEEEENIEKVYLSKRTAQAQGKITKQKGFRWLSEQEQLKLKEFKNNQRVDQENREDVLMAKIIQETRLLRQSISKKKRYSELSKIPDSYDFDYRQAFSWDRDGTPQMPTYFYRHYDYIKSMIDKIRYHWAPPGGSPRNLYQSRFHNGQYVPGYVRIRLFPPQKVGLVFMLDESGEVLDVRIKKSMGYQALNQSFIEAIRSIQNFGPPPKDFIRINRAVFPWLFKIY